MFKFEPKSRIELRAIDLMCVIVINYCKNALPLPLIRNVRLFIHLAEYLFNYVVRIACIDLKMIEIRTKV